MKKFFVIAFTAVCLLSYQNVFAQVNEKSLDELIKVMQAKEQFEDTMNMMLDQQSKAFGGKAPSELTDVIRDFNKKYMNWESLKGDIKKAYSETFTEEEVQAMIKFYATPAGQSIVKKQPQLTQKIMMITMASMQKHMPELQAAIMEVMKKKQAEAPKQQ